MQQKKRREGTLSPRSTEYQYMIKECVNYLRPSIRDIFWDIRLHFAFKITF